MNTQNKTDPATAAEKNPEPSGCAAWAPALIAGGALLAMLFFISCAGGTYYLFQQRGEFALRTIDGTLIPLIEQSRLEPDDKATTIAELRRFIRRGQSGDLEDWQIAGVMQRLVRSPILSWGDLQYVDSVIAQRESFSDEEKAAGHRDLSRLQRGAELDKVIQLDMTDIFEPISTKANHESGYSLDQEFSDEGLREFLVRVRLVAHRAEVPEKQYDVKLVSIVKRQIEAGVESGMK
ncbi:hypothetical protein Poly24_20010 [Rosistilla carotiformis]|uniref:Uncharacterized protein n=1 Tax=Rosistilla carotiformis TaxID=2528017 RepID=A0A518JRW2_9BACT|nr:hypothetical protein [Rosistilla carotiformis]QDV68292.1 hypothetical protein Poly24_20010 [Rosistilla carotiformis]